MSSYLDVSILTSAFKTGTVHYTIAFTNPVNENYLNEFVLTNRDVQLYRHTIINISRTAKLYQFVNNYNPSNIRLISVTGTLPPTPLYIYVFSDMRNSTTRNKTSIHCPNILNPIRSTTS